MPTRLFGEVLSGVVSLSQHDVLEILEDQSRSGRRFGDIALSLGLCQPEHVWQAWMTQLSHRRPFVDLSSVGVDAQATAHLPRRLALRYRAIPLRASEEGLVVAADGRTAQRAADELPPLLGKAVRVVIAERSQLRRALRTYYGRTSDASEPPTSTTNPLN